MCEQMSGYIGFRSRSDRKISLGIGFKIGSFETLSFYEYWYEQAKRRTINLCKDLVDVGGLNNAKMSRKYVKTKHRFENSWP